MDPRVEKIKQLMREHVHREWSLLELAQAVNLSVWRLSHIFASEVGKSPMQYLRQLRMERAKYLLETSFLSVKEIAHEVGLKDGSHFVRDFKKTYGDAPTRYRLRSRGVNMNESSNESESEPDKLAAKADHKSKLESTNNQQLAKAAMQSIFPLLNFLTYWALTEIGI
jgi:AraC-like DNA-binding protein